MAGSVECRPRRHFQFENKWIGEEELNPLVEHTWRSSVGLELGLRLARCAEELETWGRKLALKFKIKLQETKMKIEEVRARNDAEASRDETAYRRQLLTILDQEESHWKQRAKQFWLVDGDRNTKIFHTIANSRQKFKQLDKLKDEAGSWVEGDDRIGDVAVRYFTNIFSTHGCNLGGVINAVTPMVKEADNNFLTAPFSFEEFRKAMFDMHPDKASGPDGLNPGFYQHFWQLTRRKLYAECRKWLRESRFPGYIRPTNIVLLPKVQPPSTMKDLRPISLCNVLYRAVAKMLANRLRSVVPHVVSEERSAFIKGRSIVDNVMVAFQTLHTMS
ncbi:Transposon TX1 uncharacterized 149 kDa protein [Linum perenne]